MADTETLSSVRVPRSENGGAKLIVGLGNPGREYQGTRHNVGFAVIDTLGGKHHINVKSRRSRSVIGVGRIAWKQVILVKPQTFMNLSGRAVAELVRYYNIDISDLVVICDDVNLPLGKLRIRARGSAGGHNGLKDIIHSLGTEEFARVRIGIGSARRDMVEHVLSKFTKAEQKTMQEAIDRSADAVEVILSEGIETAMNRYNASQS